MLKSDQMLNFSLKKENTRRKSLKKDKESMVKEVRKILSKADQGLIVMVRN